MYHAKIAIALYVFFFCSHHTIGKPNLKLLAFSLVYTSMCSTHILQEICVVKPIAGLSYQLSLKASRYTLQTKSVINLRTYSQPL